MRTRFMMPAVIFAVASAALPALAQTTTYDAPTFDRWNYPFNGSTGFRDVATTFSSGFVPGQFDDRDGQFVVTYVTAGDYQSGLGAQNYVINGATVTATVDPRFGGTFTYDSTQDAFNTYRAAFEPGFAPDTDEGRPVELFGTGFNAGFNAQSWNDMGPYGFGAPTSEDIRIAYAADFDESGDLRNVSNNVRDGFEVNPFAVGRIDGLASGDVVIGDSTYVFDIDVSNAAIQAYIAESLNAGIVSFTISSLHLAVQGQADGFPGFYTNESFFSDAQSVTLTLDVTIVPAPGATLIAFIVAPVAARRRRA